MPRFSWKTEEERFKRRVTNDVEIALKATAHFLIGPGSTGRVIAERVADRQWDFERYRIKRERSAERDRVRSEGGAR